MPLSAESHLSSGQLVGSAAVVDFVGQRAIEKLSAEQLHPVLAVQVDLG